MPLKKYSFFILLLVLLPACIIPGCMVRQELTVTVNADQPFSLNWLSRLATYEKQSSKLIIWRYGQPRYVTEDGKPEPEDPERSRLYTEYANRLETCCLSAVYMIPVGSFTVDAPRGSAIIQGAGTSTLRVFNADARTAQTLFQNISLTVPNTAPRRQLMTVIFYSFWNPLPATARLENYDPRPLSKGKDALMLPWVLGTRGRYTVVSQAQGGGNEPPPDVEIVDLPEIDIPAEPDPIEEAPPNQDAPIYPEAADNDGDGLLDPVDRCPNEGDQGYGIDATGCPRHPDTDQDGIWDDIDMCPNDGDQGYGVGSNGCPLTPDSDGDGYNDYVDMCPNDGNQGNGLDSTGCPIPGDTDGDGVSDYYDECPNDGDQGNGIDSTGCPIPGDSDGDGVNDYYDECPVDGDKGNGVDSIGCPIE